MLNNFIIKEKLFQKGLRGIKYQLRRLVGQIDAALKKN